MNVKKILTSVLLAAGVQAGLFAQAKIKILFIGDSYTLRNDLAYRFQEIAESKGEIVDVEIRAIDAMPLRFHAKSKRTLDSIKKGDWNYVVLQEQSLRPAASEQKFMDSVYYYASFLDEKIKQSNPNTKTLFYMTWGRNNSTNCGQNTDWSAPCNYTEMDDLIQSRYFTLAKGLNATVVPVGKVKRYLSEDPAYKGYKWDADKTGHPTELATYATACTFYTIIFKKDPSNITRRFGLKSDSASAIRVAVKKVVFDHLEDYSFPQQETPLVTTTTTGTTVTIFPHPFEDVLNIQTMDRLHSVKLTSITTRQQVADFNNLDGNSFQLITSSSSIPSGMYSLHVQTDRNVSNILVEKK